MRIKKIFCLFFCLILFLSSCAKDSGDELQSTTSVATTEAETTVVFPSKLTNENTTIGDYGTVNGNDSEKYKVFVNYEWVISNDFFECYYNPQNLEEPYHKENRYGIADKNGNIIIEPQFAFIWPATNDRFIVGYGVKNEIEEIIGAEYAVINSKCEIIIPFSPYVDEMIDYYDGLESNYFCVCVEEDKYYIADNNGNMVYDMYFTSFHVAHPKNNYSDKTHRGVYNGEVYCFDNELNIIEIYEENPMKKESLCTYRGMEYYKIGIYQNGKYSYGVVNETTGEEIVPCKYDEITLFAEDRILAEADNNEAFVTSSSSEHYGNTIAIYNLYGKVLCQEGTYHTIYLQSNWKYYEAVGIASSYNPNGNRIYGAHYEWLIDKNGIKISDTYYSINYNQYGEMAGYYTADRGDRVFYLNKYGHVVGTIGA